MFQKIILMIPIEPSNAPTLRRSGRVSRPPEYFIYMGEVFIMIADESSLDPITYEEARECI